MADRYWVGGTGSWAATTTNWSATDGGSGGASVPTLNDDVFFTSLSNATAYTCTLTTAPVCRSVNIVGPLVGNVTIAGSAAWLIYGSMTIAATGVTRTFTSALTFAATTTGWTITTNGISLASAITLNGAGGDWTLGSALTTSGAFTVTQGSFVTANFNLTASGGFNAQGALTRSLTLGSSAISCLTWNCLSATNLTVNAGTSTITVTQAAGTFNGGGLMYYNVFKASNGFAIGDAGNTFNALTNNNVTVSGTFLCSFAGDQTIGTLTVNGGSNQRARASIQTPATLVGTQVTLTVGSFVTNGYIDFRDINFVGVASPLTVATGGDCGNNTNITLQTPKTVYWNLAAGGGWNSSVAWALTSGGAPAVANIPLPQDTAIIEDTGLNSGATITFANNPNLCTIDISTRTLPVTLSLVAGSPFIYGDLTLSSSVAITSTTGSVNFGGFNKTQTFTSAGITFDAGVFINNPSTTVTLAGALTLGSTKTATLTKGALDLNNNNLTCGTFSSTNSNTRSIAFGTGQIYVVGSGGFNINLNIMTGFTYTGSGTFNATYSGGVGTRGFTFGNSGGGNESNALNINIPAGTDLVQVYGAGLRSINFTGFAGTWVEAGSRTLYGDLTISTGMSVTATTSTLFSASSGTQNITSNGKTVTFSILKTGAGTLRLLDALTLEGTQSVVLVAGGLNMNGNDLTTGLFDSYTSSVREITIGSNTITVTGSTWSVYDSGFTITGTGIINMTSASAKTFIGSGYSYPTLNQGGSGSLLITGSNAFANITNTVQPATVTFESGTTTSVANFSLLGTAGNLITINSSLAGAQSTLNNTSGGPIVTDYLSIQDSNATPATTMYAGRNSTDVSNNTGWVFATLFAVLIDESSTITDAEDAQLTFTLLTEESLTLTDEQSAQMDWSGLTVELLNSTDSASATVIFIPNISESITLVDALIQRGWIKINDNQNPDWGAINNNQTPTWGAINDDQTPGWADIDNYQG